MARVVLCVQNMPVPSDRRVWREARTLRDAGHDVSVIGPGGDGLARKERLDGIEIRRWGTPTRLGGVVGQVTETLVALGWTAWYLFALGRRGRIDVVHAANPPDAYFVLARILRPFGVRFVFDQHDVCPELLDAQAGPTSLKAWVLGPVLRFCEQRSYRAADLVVAPNNSYRRIAIQRGRVDPDAVVVIRSGPDELVPTVPRRDDLVIAFVGMINPQDRVDVLVDAAAIVLERRPGALRVVIAGTGDDVRPLQARAAQRGVADAITWTGWLTGAPLCAVLQDAWIAVSLDDDSEFNRVSTMLKITEYLAFALPCLVADLPESRATAGDAARAFVPGDAASLAEQIEVLLDDPSVLEGLRRQAEARAPALLWEHSARRLVAAYEWLLNDGPVVAGDQHVEVAGATALERAPVESAHVA